MPWKECHVMDERLRFVARLLEGETMVALCEEFGISRKTGHKIYQRYRQIGVQGLTDRSRRPHRHANQLPMVVEKTIVKMKREYPSWGAPKIRERLRQRWPEVHCNASVYRRRKNRLRKSRDFWWAHATLTGRVSRLARSWTPVIRVRWISPSNCPVRRWRR